MAEDIGQLESMLEHGDMEGAGTLFQGILAAEQGGKDEAEAIVAFAEVYTDVMASLGERYRAALEIAVRGLEKVKHAQVAVADSVRIGEVRKSLGM